MSDHHVSTHGVRSASISFNPKRIHSDLSIVDKTMLSPWTTLNLQSNMHKYIVYGATATHSSEQCQALGAEEPSLHYISTSQALIPKRTNKPTKKPKIHILPDD